jgi:kynurenine formamidase
LLVADLPRFDELPILEELGLRTSWGVFGKDDRVGTVNLLTSERVASSSRLIESGEQISLSLALDEPSPPTHHRRAYRHQVFAIDRNNFDDTLDSFYLQGSTQWDALRHVRCREFGFYNNASEDSLGVDQWAARGGIVGRGVLLDVAGYLESIGSPLNPLGDSELTVELLELTLAFQNSTLETGSIALIRTGWMSSYLGGDAAKRSKLVNASGNPGLHAGEEMARFLWNNAVAAVAADNKTLEVAPGDASVGSLHRRLIPCLGMAVGELFNLEELAAKCARESRYHFFFASVPLNLAGGVGSPPNAIVIW